MQFYDIHSHILPGIDDGASDTEASLEMLSMAKDNGTGCIIMTPHYIHGSINNSSGIVQDKCKELQSSAENAGLGGIKILTGSELFICPELPELVRDKAVCTLNDSSYVLVELPINNIPVYTEEVLYRLRLYGFNPIIAHPERNTGIQANPELLVNLVKTGSLAQVNASCITGIYGRKVQKLTYKLISRNLVHFVASDSHTCRGRSPKLNIAYDEIAGRFGSAAAERLFITNGKAVAENKEILAEEPKAEKRRFFFGLLPYLQ